MTQLISFEKFTNIQNAQAGLTRLFAKAEKSASFYRVLKNDKPVGVLLPEKIWRSFVEDLEALSSPNFRSRISRARRQKKTFSASYIKKELGL